MALTATVISNRIVIQAVWTNKCVREKGNGW